MKKQEAFCVLDKQTLCISREEFQWPQILVSFQKGTRIINLWYLFFVISSNVLLRCMLDYLYFLAPKFIYTGSSPASSEQFTQNGHFPGYTVLSENKTQTDKPTTLTLCVFTSAEDCAWASGTKWKNNAIKCNQMKILPMNQNLKMA